MSILHPIQNIPIFCCRHRHILSFVTKDCPAKLTKKLIAAHVKVVIWSFAKVFFGFLAIFDWQKEQHSRFTSE
jgi:hypothetical protein